MADNHVRVRFAPSPTGDPHVGSMWIALFNYIFAKQRNGTFILRIEDTDQKRLVPGAKEKILEAMAWYGLHYDEGPYIQSERLELHRAAAERLVASQHAYYCFCTPERLEELRAKQAAAKLPPKYDKQCATLDPEEVRRRLGAGESAVIRLNVPATGSVTHHDLVRGDVTFALDQIDDQVLMKSDGFPTYHLANVVDDHEMNISHVIRAEEWLPSVPKHLLLYEALGWTPPAFAHLPLLLGKDRAKLSKRHGATSALSFRDLGYVPEAMVNFLALMGWHPKGESEVLSMDDIIAQFKIEDMSPSGAIFDETKLEWLNGQYLRAMSAQEVVERAEPWLKQLPERPAREWLERATAIVQDRVHRLSQLPEHLLTLLPSGWDGALETFDAAMAIPKKGERTDVHADLGWAMTELQDMPEPWEATTLKETMLAKIASSGKKNMNVLWPLRVALTLQAASPDVFDVAALLGKQETARRVGKLQEALT